MKRVEGKKLPSGKSDSKEVTMVGKEGRTVSGLLYVTVLVESSGTPMLVVTIRDDEHDTPTILRCLEKTYLFLP